MALTTNSPSELIDQAREHIRNHNLGPAHDLLREYLLHNYALLWLAKVAASPAEALTAATLALMLDPDNEQAQKAVRTVSETDEVYKLDPTEMAHAITRQTGFTRSQACAVTWPFKNVNRPLGEVFDAGLVTQKDLLWAKDNAFDPKVKAAAETLLYHEILGRPQPAYDAIPTVIRAGWYTEEQEQETLIKAAAGFALLCFVLSFGIDQVVQNVIESASWLRWILTFILYGGLTFVGLRMAWRNVILSASFGQGRHGEEKVIENLSRHLDGRTTIIRNWQWPGTKRGDVDLLVVGPHGVWACEVKAYLRHVRNIGDRWQTKGRFGWFNLSKNPGKQVRRNAVMVKEYLSTKGIEIPWVEPIVVWAAWTNERSSLEIRDAAIPVWHVETLSEDLQALLTRTRSLDGELIDRIVRVFSAETQL